MEALLKCKNKNATKKVNGNRLSEKGLHSVEREIFNFWQEIGILRSKKGYLYAGLPTYQGLFGRDSLISSWQLLSYDLTIARATLVVLAESQGRKTDHKTGEEPGKILHEFYPKDTQDDWWNKYKAEFSWLERGKPVYMSHDSTPLFLIVAGKYFEKTNDTDFISSIFSGIEKAADWINNYGDIDGDNFLEYENKNGNGLVHQGWKDSTENHLCIEQPVALIEIQGYAYLAFIEAAKLVRLFGKNVLADELLAKADRLKMELNNKFWMPDEKFFCLALDGKKRQVKTITSNQGHLLFTGIIEKDKIDPVIERLFMPDMWTPYGIRTHSELEKNFDPSSYHHGSVWPHDNWMIAQGLEILGYKREYQKIKDAIIAAYRKLGFMPEYYYVINGEISVSEKACYPQAWSSGVLPNFYLVTKTIQVDEKAKEKARTAVIPSRNLSSRIEMKLPPCS